MTERIHAYNAKVFLQMSGGFGRVTIPTNLGEFPPVAPSPIQHRWLDKTCRELTVDEIKSIIKKFGDGAFNAKRAGFDGVQIHAVHEGYLIDQFAMTLFNHRTDEYGGSLENRLRFAREIVEEIKDRCGEDFPVTLRYSPKSFIKDLRDGALPGEEFVEKGRDLEEGVEAAKLLVSYGYDSLDTDVGSYDAWWWSHPPMYQEKGLYRPYCKSIRPCISCQEGYMGRIQHYSMLNCAVNPKACREKDMAVTPILKKKKILIVGGGVAGCEAARVLALRGHEPVLYEKSNRLGGNLIPGGAPDFKEDDIALADWYAYTLKELNVEVNLNTQVTKEQILKFKADSLIIATGSTPKVFSLGDDDKVFTAIDVLLGKKDAGNKTVVVGGGLVGCELALDLAKKGKEVTIVEALNKILAINGPLCSANSEMLEKLIPFNNIDVKTNSKIKAYKDGVLEMKTENGIEKIECDSVILCVVYKEENSLYTELEFEIPEIHLLGDARKVSNIMYAIWDAYEVSNHI
jgi:2-enoate reductase